MPSLKRKGLILKGLSLFSCLNITIYSVHARCTLPCTLHILLNSRVYKPMNRTDIKRRPLSDTVLANPDPASNDHRELDGEGLYFRVKPDGKKA